LLQEFLGSKWEKLVLFICLSQITTGFREHQPSQALKEARSPVLIAQYNRQW